MPTIQKKWKNSRLVPLDILSNSDNLKGIVKSYPGRSRTPRSWRDQLDTTIVSQYLATYISGHSGYHAGPSPSASYIIKWKKVSCAIEDFVETHHCKLRGILRSRVPRVLRDLIKNVCPYWGGQNLTAVELSECTNMWLWICKRPYLHLLDVI